METTTNLSVFLVDDDKMFITSMAHHLKEILKSSAIVKVFPTGEECLQNLNQKPTIVVLDYFLKGQYPDAMNGIDVLKKIKETNPETEVIMLSAQDKIEVAIDVMKHGAYDYIVKNDNAFVRMKKAIVNAAHSISLSKEEKDYKFWIRVFIIAIILIVAVIINVRILYPNLF